MNLRRLLIGNPLATRQEKHERLTNMQGLGIFGSDPLSSTAYATEEILWVLALAGTASLYISLSIALVITSLIILVSISYRQAIFAYPQGGGVYNVAKENLGENFALIAAASLLIDYVLTAAVSVSAGVLALISAFPELAGHKIVLGILVISVLAIAALRGIRESGRLFSIPTYNFLVIFAIFFAYGLFRKLTGSFPAILPPTDTLKITETLGIILIFRAFASGCAAMTGIEAISNGVPTFKEPESKNAAHTMTVMAVILSAIFLGLTLFAYWSGAQPSSNETIISQIARALFGTTIPYYAIQGVTIMILLLAANTPFAGFPGVAARLAHDGYFPRQLENLGSRLVYANGIIILGICAALLIWLFKGDVHALIPLYAVGVFLGFSLSQAGMINHWRKLGARAHIPNIAINTAGLIATSIVFAIILFSKLVQGAWILIPTIIFIVLGMKKIKNHYRAIKRFLSLEEDALPQIAPDKTMIILVSEINRSSLFGVNYAKSFRPKHLQALHVTFYPEKGKMIKREWHLYNPDVPIDIVHSEYRDLVYSVIEHLKILDKKWIDDKLVVVMPEIIPNSFWQKILHNQDAWRIKLAIEQDPELNVDILDVPLKIPA